VVALLHAAGTVTPSGVPGIQVGRDVLKTLPAVRTVRAGWPDGGMTRR
jgi:hypothetical protein